MNSDQVSELANLLRSQRELIDDLQRRVDELEANKSPHTMSNSAAIHPPTSVEDQTRRGFLRLAGAAAAGAAVTAISAATPAAASDGLALLQTATNTGTGETIVTNTTNSPGGNPASTISALRGNGGDNSVGLFGKSNGSKGAGIQGSSDLGYGVYGEGLTGYSMYAGGGGRYGMDAHSAAGSDAPTSGSYALGDIFRNSVGDVYVCTVGGLASPGGSATFHKLAGPSSAGSLHLVSAARIFDSRAIYDQPGGGGLPGDRFNNAQSRVVNTASYVPLRARAVMISLAAFSTLSGGYLTAYPTGTSDPRTINCYWATGGNAASTTVVALNPARQFTLTLRTEGSAIMASADLLGYYL